MLQGGDGQGIVVPAAGHRVLAMPSAAASLLGARGEPSKSWAAAGGGARVGRRRSAASTAWRWAPGGAPPPAERPSSGTKFVPGGALVAWEYGDRHLARAGHLGARQALRSGEPRRGRRGGPRGLRRLSHGPPLAGLAPGAGVVVGPAGAGGRASACAGTAAGLGGPAARRSLPSRHWRRGSDHRGDPVGPSRRRHASIASPPGGRCANCCWHARAPPPPAHETRPATMAMFLAPESATTQARR